MKQTHCGYCGAELPKEKIYKSAKYCDRQCSSRAQSTLIRDKRPCKQCMKLRPVSDFFKKHTRCKDCERLNRRKYKGDSLFWGRIWKRTKQLDSCLEWTGRYNKNTPVCQYKSKNISVRRLLYIKRFGEFDSSMYVVTSCNNCKCINPNHYILINKQSFYIRLSNNQPSRKGNDKTRDIRKGEQIHTAQINEEKVKHIRRLHADGCASKDIASIMGVSLDIIQRVVARKTWKHVE